MNAEYFTKSLWLFVLLFLWLKPLQYKRAKWFAFSLAMIAYGAALWLGWFIFSLPLPLTDLHPGQKDYSYANYNTIFYDDKCAVMDEDSSGQTKFVVVSLQDGKVRQRLPYTGNSYAQINNWKYASGEHAQAFLFGNPPNALMIVRNDSLLGYREVNPDTTREFVNSLFYNETEKCFEVVSRNYHGHYDSFPDFRYDEHFNLVHRGVFYLDQQNLNYSVYAKDGPLFMFEGVTWLSGQYAAFSVDNIFVALKPQGDTLVYDRGLPVSDTTFVNYSGYFLMRRNANYGVKTRKGVSIFHLRKNWLKDTTGEVQWNLGDLKLTNDGLVPDYSGIIFDNDTFRRKEQVYGKYVVRYESYYDEDGSRDEKDPGEGWRIYVEDTVAKREFLFRLHDRPSAYPEIFLAGDTLVVFSDRMEKMARFNLKSGERLDKIDRKTHFYDRIYYFRQEPSAFYTGLLLITYFFLPFMLVLFGISMLVKRKWFWPWFNLQRISALYTVIALITLIQMHWRIF